MFRQYTRRPRRWHMAVMVKQPAFNQRLGCRYRLRQVRLCSRVHRERELTIQNLAHLETQRIRKIRTDKIIGFRAHAAGFQQIQLCRELPMQQRAILLQQKIELTDRIVLVGAYLQSIRNQYVLMFKVIRHQAFRITPQPCKRLHCEIRMQSGRIAIQFSQPGSGIRACGTRQRRDFRLPLRRMWIEQIRSVDEPCKCPHVRIGQMMPALVKTVLKTAALSRHYHKRPWQGTSQPTSFACPPDCAASMPGDM